MNTKFQSFQIFQNRSRWIFLLFFFDVLFMVLTVITLLTPDEDVRHFSYAFSLLAVITLLITIVCSYRNLQLITKLQKLFLTNDYGASAYRIMQFHKIMNENLFEYYFQPIISTKTGEIFAYEALMRSNLDSIQMTPLEILDLAAKEERLYEIEKCTFFNVIKLMEEYSDVFSKKKLFINSIPGHQLNDEDFYQLYEQYGPLFKNIVMEITELTYLDDAGIRLLHQRLKDTGCQLALDDYGTGFSNESNLLNTNPNYIKIDHAILHCINVDTKKQQLVANLVKFAKHNNIQVIAEGIETYDEFKYVISLGVDYIQGYYTAKPEPVLVESMSDDLLHKLRTINYMLSEETGSTKAYITKNDHILSPVALNLESYTKLIVYDDTLHLQGRHDMVSNLSIQIPDNHACHLILDNVHLSSSGTPSISLGINSKVTLKLIGKNRLDENGIWVPQSSELTLTGDGNLTINLNKASTVGIGSNLKEAYGNLTFEGTGAINIKAFTNAPIGIGGGYNPLRSKIRFHSGDITVHVSGYQAVAIGSMNDYAHIMIGACKLHIKAEATNSLGIGCLSGMLKIESEGELDMHCQGQSCVAVGALDAGEGSIHINGGKIDMRINGNKGAGIGSIGSDVDVTIKDGDINIFGQGANLVGIGDQTGHGRISIHSGSLIAKIIAMHPMSIGNMKKEVIIDGGNIHCDFPEDAVLKNSFGTSLISRVINGTDNFCQLIDTRSYRYEYRAKYNPNHPYIKVYLPDSE